MASQRNLDSVTSLKEKVSRSRSLVLANYQGLTHKQAEELHRAVKRVGGEFLVVKNSLLRLATTDTAYTFETTDLTGPVAVLFSYDDEIAPLKELSKTVKALGLPTIKVGFVGATKYTSSQLEAVAKLPGIEVVRAQFVGRLNAPLYSLVSTLNGNISKLVYILSQIKKS